MLLSAEGHLNDKFHLPMSPLSHQSIQVLPQPQPLNTQQVRPSCKSEVPQGLRSWRQLEAKWISEQNEASRLHLHGAPAT